MNLSAIKIGACALVYKGTVLGAVERPILKMESTYEDITCDQSYDQPVRRTLRSTTVTLTAAVREIDTGMGLLLDGSGRIEKASLGQEQTQTGGELLLIPFNLNDTTGYRLPHAVLNKKTQYAFDDSREHSLELEFEGFMNENGVMLEKFTVTDDQRITMSNTLLDPAQIERALTQYIAEKLGLTVDKDIFRGGIIPGQNGCGVYLLGENLLNPASMRHFDAEVSFRHEDRDVVMNAMTDLAAVLPKYGVTINDVTGGGVIFSAIIKKSQTYMHPVADGGQLKQQGIVSLVLII